MPIPVTCECGKLYKLKDEFAGKVLNCPQCGAPIQVGQPQGNRSEDNMSDPALGGNLVGKRQSLRSPSLHPVFNREKFLLRQKILTISEKYDVCDEEGNPILYIERPAHFIRNLGATFTGLIAGIFAGGLFFGLAAVAAEPLIPFLILLGLFAWLAVTFVVIVLLYKKRHVTIYCDRSKQEPLLKVFQAKKIEILRATFVVKDTTGELATLSKNYLYDFIRKHWHCYAPDGSLICIAKEDSIILSILRRLLGNFYGILRTNFIIVHGNSDRVIGEFNRKFTLFDRYVLDMSADPQRALDRRIAIALGVMLDTGERR